MQDSLIKAFNSADVAKVASKIRDIVSLNYGINKKTGERFVRAVMNNGTTLIKSVTESGIEKNIKYVIPAFKNVEERNKIIRDLSKQKLTQNDIACIMNISQSTVSNVLRRK